MACGLLAAAVLALSSCSFMAVRSSSQTFLLDPGAPPRAARTIGGDVQVGFVDVSSPYSLGNFQYRLTESDWETDPYNRFLTSPQEMMTGVIRSWLEKSRSFSTVVIPGSGAVPDFVIQCEVTAMLIDFRDPGSPSAVIRMKVLVTRASNSGPPEVVLRDTFDSRSPVTDRTPEAFVDAWNLALRKSMLSFSASMKTL